MVDITPDIDHHRRPVTDSDGASCGGFSRGERPMAGTRFESSVTAISWIPSEAIQGLPKIPFELGVTHYDDVPPDQIDDLDALRRTDRFREANELRAFIEVDDGRIVGHGHLGGGHIGATTVRVGPGAIRFPAVHLPDIRPDPEVSADSVRFVQTVGGRMGLPTPRPVRHRPFVQFWPSIAWTTLALTLHADGSSTHELVGASPFPRHWIYDHSGRLVEKSGVIDFETWFNDSFGDRTPWGTSDSPVVVASVESELERQLSTAVMQGGTKPDIRALASGDALVEQGQPGTDVYLILDGIFVVEVDGDPVAEIGPGAVVGERAAREGGKRTATLRARTSARVAAIPADRLDAADLDTLAASHRREDVAGT
jgi:Cyclic nucleotide-binding domain